MRLFIALFTVIASAGLCRAEEAAVVWSDADLNAYATKLAPKINEEKFAIENLGDYGNHYILMVHREGSGPAEVHDAQTDFYVVRKGSGTLHLGGKVVGGKTTAPGEIRGARLDGARTIPLKEGDTVNIPPKTPHQVTLEAGETITYMIVKVHAR